MAKLISASALIAEIERRIEENKQAEKRFIPNFGYFAQNIAELYGILDFVNSLPEPQLPANIDQAAENYIAPIENDEGLDYINFSGRDIRDAFIAGAEWQKQQMLRIAKDRFELAMTFVTGNSEVDQAIQRDRLVLVKIIEEDKK